MERIYHAREARQFEDYLKRKGLKLTPERRALFDEIFARHQHFEADDLLFRLKTKNKKISRATIYRTLELMVDSGVVGRVRIGETGYRYERMRAGDHHDHLICTQCGRVVEFREPRIESLQDDICERYGFVLISHSHQLHGICRRCRPHAKSRARASAAAHLSAIPTR
jgi:Fur family transcriptional regulator, ferric uptake regulator